MSPRTLLIGNGPWVKVCKLVHISCWSVKLLKLPSVTFVAQTVTIGEQKVCPESESLKFSTTPTPQVENRSDSYSSTPTPQPWAQVQLNRHKYKSSHHRRTRPEYFRKLVSCRCTATWQNATFGRDTFQFKNFPCCRACKGSRPLGNCLTPPWGGATPRLRTTDLNWPTCKLIWKSFQIYTITTFALVVTSWFLEMNNIYSTNAFAFVLFVRFFCAN